MNRPYQDKITGFTLIEAVIAIFILSILSLMIIGSIAIFQKRTELNNSIEEFANILKLAQSKTLASENSSQYGVYINTAATPGQYVLFKGIDYASRIAASDQIYSLPKSVEFSSVNLGGGNEIVFEKLSGVALQSGTVSLRLRQDTSQVKTVYIANSGTIGFTQAQTPLDEARVKDSRHLHVNYSRIINTASENVILTFDATVVKTLPIASNLAAGEFYWQGTVSAGGSSQTVTVQTHRLNNPDTQFSIQRSRSLNDKTLKLTISGDASGSLAQYSADGVTTTYSSIYVSNFAWQ